MIQQIDLFDLVNKPGPVKEKQNQPVVVEKIDMTDFERIKSERALKIDPDDLLWRPASMEHEEECNVLAVIPPNAINSTEWGFRFGFRRGKYHNPEKDACFNLWKEYTSAIWWMRFGEIDWGTAILTMERHRDSGEPVWMRATRYKGKPYFIPECIVDYERPVLRGGRDLG